MGNSVAGGRLVDTVLSCRGLDDAGSPKSVLEMTSMHVVVAPPEHSAYMASLMCSAVVTCKAACKADFECRNFLPLALRIRTSLSTAATPLRDTGYSSRVP